MQSTATISDIGIDYKTNKAKITFLFDNKEVLRQAEELQDKKLNVEAKKWYKKRSLDANSYCWKICDEIGKKLSTDNAVVTKEVVYKDAINNIGTFQAMIFEEKNFEKCKDIWEKQGLGFLVKEISRKDKCVKVFCYYGSSTYDTKEMSLLIELLVQQAKSLGIETKTKQEIDSLLKAWDCGTR